MKIYKAIILTSVALLARDAMAGRTDEIMNGILCAGNQ